MNISELKAVGYTDKEISDIENGGTAYHREWFAELSSLGESPNTNLHRDLYAEFERLDRDELKYLNEDITLLVRVRETFMGNQDIRALCEYFLRIDQAEIADRMEIIIHDRQEQARPF